MAFLITKYAITAFIIVLVSEVAKRTDKPGALIASLPFVTIIAMIWLPTKNRLLRRSPTTLTTRSGTSFPPSPCFFSCPTSSTRAPVSGCPPRLGRPHHRLLRAHGPRHETLQRRPDSPNGVCRLSTCPRENHRSTGEFLNKMASSFGRWRMIDQVAMNKQPASTLGLLTTLVALLSSCATTERRESNVSDRDISTRVSRQWERTSRSPLVFHPADSGSDSLDGNWIAAGDAWFFIPQHGLSHDARMALITETFDLREQFGAPTDPTPPKMAGRDNCGDPGQQAGDAALGLYGKAVGGMGQAVELTMFSLMLMGWPFVGADPGW